MRKYRIYIVFVILAGFVLAFKTSQSVYASPYKLDPTATWDIRTPPYTPAGTQSIGQIFPTTTATALNLNCPAGTPVGYGTVTPGLNWVLQCGQCLPTETGLPTVDFTQVAETNAAPFTTGTPSTGTPTSTATVSITPTPYPSTNLYLDSTHITTGANGTAYIEGETISCTGSGTTTIVCDVAFHWVDPDPSYDPAIEVAINFHANQYAVIYEKTDFNLEIGWQRNYVSPSVIFGTNFSANTFYPDGVTYSYPTLSYGIAGGILDRYYTYRVVFTSISEGWNVTPSPTPTLPSDTCAVIDDSSYDFSHWFDFIGPTGSKACFFTPYISASEFLGSGWISYFSFIFPQPIVDFIASAVVPAQTWCFNGVGFTVINLWGFLIDPTVFADLGIALFVLYHFLTK